MAVTQNLVTSNFNVHSAAQFIESFSEQSNTQYFVYAGNHLPYANNDGSITTPTNSVQATHIDAYNNMIFAKKINPTDVVHVVPKYKWVSGSTYAEYSHNDATLFDKQFFVMVDDTSEYNVYKCLYNNANAASTVSPYRDLLPIVTGDGYIWKYMYTITKSNYEKFATSNYIPVTANNTIIDSAIPGTIEVIKVLDGGAGYSNYITSASFKTGDINVGGVNTIYGAPESASYIDDYYQGCVLKITSGLGIEQYRRIVNYEGVGAQKKFVLDSGFSITPSVNDTYEVYPYVYVWGDGSETAVADGRALVDPTSNTITDVEMLSVGANYRYGISIPGDTPATTPISISTIYIQLPEVISQDSGFQEAVLEPVLSPKGGHGSDPWNELNARRVCISTKFSQSESGTIPVQNDFRQVGLIKNPLFHNVDLMLQTGNTIGSFSIGETVYQYKPAKLAGNVSVSTATTALTLVDQGKIASTITVLNAGTGYDSSVNNSLIFDNTGTGATSTAVATFVSNSSFVVQANVQSNNGVSSNFILLSGAATTFGNDKRVKYFTFNPSTGITGLSNNAYYYVVSANSLGMKLSSTISGPPLTISSNISDAGNVCFAVVNGSITSVSVVSQGAGYTVAPTVSVAPAGAIGASSAQFLPALANPVVPSYDTAFDIGDSVLVTTGTANYLTTVAGLPSAYQITTSTVGAFNASAAEVSSIRKYASGKVTAISTGQITLSNVSGAFTEGSRLIGMSTGTTTITKSSNSSFTAIQVNDKAAGTFATSTQLTRLVGDFTLGSSSFIEDEYVSQGSLISYAKPRGYLHHTELNGGTNDDILYISNKFGIFNLDPMGVREVTGATSEAVLGNLLNQYPGDFVVGSGEVLYYENLDPITRSDNKSEIMKIILEF
jgi:hypothetical protein